GAETPSPFGECHAACLPRNGPSPSGSPPVGRGRRGGPVSSDGGRARRPSFVLPPASIGRRTNRGSACGPTSLGLATLYLRCASLWGCRVPVLWSLSLRSVAPRLEANAVIRVFRVLSVSFEESTHGTSPCPRAPRLHAH